MTQSFNAAIYNGTAEQGRQLQNVGEFGDRTLTFARADGAALRAGDLELEPGGGGDLVVDTGSGPQSFTVISTGTLRDNNQNQLKDLQNVSQTPGDIDYVTIELEDGTTLVFFPGYPDVAGDGAGNLRIDDSGSGVFICFCEGTLIVTDRGEVAVESLRVGDRVLTRDAGFQPIRWIGDTTVRRTPTTAPVLIRAGALGEGSPSRDLRVSPQHRILMRDARLDLHFGVGEALVPARHLVNATSVVRETGAGTVRYFHILFDTHQIVYSDGLPTESFHPGPWGLNALDSAARDEVLALFPQLAEAAESYGPSARLSLKRHEARMLAR